MAVLRSEVKVFIVQALACFDTPSQVVAAVKTEFGIEITRQQCETHDPTKFAGQKLGKTWVDLFHAETMKNIGLAMQILEQAAKETGDIYVNRARKEEVGDQPVIPTRIQVDVVDARKPNAEP
jgi:hypothetical protein